MNIPARPEGVDTTDSSCPAEKKIRTKYGYLNLTQNPQHEEFKLRILIKKGTGNAAYRNYIKRIIREYLRHERSKLIFYNDCVFYFHSSDKINYMDLQNELNSKISSMK